VFECPVDEVDNEWGPKKRRLFAAKAARPIVYQDKRSGEGKEEGEEDDEDGDDSSGRILILMFFPCFLLFYCIVCS
jgi:hypothetical protein